MVASGGFATPANAGISFALTALRISPLLPAFSASRGRIRWEDPAERWARLREREMRAYSRMWDWP